MRPYWFFLLLLLLSCSKDKNDHPDSVGCQLDMEVFDLSFGINYSSPSDYLIPGNQSRLSDEHFQMVYEDIGEVSTTISGVKSLANWILQNFQWVNAGGNEIGQNTVDDLYDDRVIYGCHSVSLVQIGLLRAYGFPCAMVETASVRWIKDFNDGLAGGYVGHVMTEVYVEDRWILLENNGSVVYDYETMNPFISHDQLTDGLLVYAKGKDTWDYGIFSESDTHIRMRETADHVDCFNEFIGSVDYKWE